MYINHIKWAQLLHRKEKKKTQLHFLYLKYVIMARGRSLRRFCKGCKVLYGCLYVCMCVRACVYKIECLYERAI